MSLNNFYPNSVNRFLYYISATFTLIASGLCEQTKIEAMEEECISASILDPKKFYISKFEAADNDLLISINADLNADGVDELLLSYSESNKYSDGILWHVFFKSGGFWQIVTTADSGKKHIAAVLLSPSKTMVGEFPPGSGKCLVFLNNETSEDFGISTCRLAGRDLIIKDHPKLNKADKISKEIFQQISEAQLHVTKQKIP